MTQPKHGPFRFHFISGVESERDVKPHLKRQFGWLPNKMKGGSTKKRKRKKK